MAYKFVQKRNTAQEELAYIAYMIVSSYFHKATCRNQQMAERLFLYYAEMKTAAQESREQEMIVKAEATLKPFKTIFSEMNCDVWIRFVDRKYILDFITGFEQIHIEVGYVKISRDKVKAECEMQVIHI